jgi:hypothetical protein
MRKSEHTSQPCGGKAKFISPLPINPNLLFVLLLALLLLLITARVFSQSSTCCPSAEVRFGFGVAGGDITEYAVENLHAGWYVNWGTLDNLAHPDGLEFMHIIRVNGSTYSPSKATLRPIVENNLGSTWLIGNEPDCIWQDNSTPDQYAQVYHELYTFLKETDPSCQVAIGGVVQPTPLRLQWLNMVLTAYQSRYGEKMPVDVWNIHNFVLRELKGSWGCEIPPGVNATQGRLYSVQDHDNMTYFKQHIVAFRQWMKDNGEQDKPLIISEYGILMPCDWYGFCDTRVRNFMLATFDYFMGAESVNPSLGYPADGYRMVQRWAWYSLNDNNFEATDTHSNLFTPSTKVITVVGQAYGNYAASLSPIPYVDLIPTTFSATPTQPLFYGEPMTITLGATVANRGNTDTTQDFNVSFWDGDPSGGANIGERNVPGLSGQWGQAAIAPIDWTTTITEPRRVHVWCDSGDDVVELCREDNNQTYRTFFVDLALSSTSFEPPVPFAPVGQSVTVTIKTTVANEGNVGARNVQVSFWNGDPDSGGTLIGSRVIATLSAGSSAQTQIDWPEVEGGTYQVYVRVDPDNTLAELEETNNKEHKGLLVAKVKFYFPLVMKGYR